MVSIPGEEHSVWGCFLGCFFKGRCSQDIVFREGFLQSRYWSDKLVFFGWQFASTTCRCRKHLASTGLHTGMLLLWRFSSALEAFCWLMTLRVFFLFCYQQTILVCFLKDLFYEPSAREKKLNQDQVLDVQILNKWKKVTLKDAFRDTLRFPTFFFPFFWLWNCFSFSHIFV